MISQPIGHMPLGHPATVAGPQAAASPDPVFSGLARLAANACSAPLAFMAVIGYPDIWCTSTAQPTAAMPQEDPRAGHTLLATCALCTTRGEALGTLAVYDTAARPVSREQHASLLLLAEQAVANIELRSRLTELALLCSTSPGARAPHADAVSATALLDSAPVAIYHTDAAGNMGYSNPEYRRIFGLQPEHSTDTWAQRVHPDDRGRMQQAWAEFCRLRIPSHFAYRTLFNGAVRHFSEQVVAADGIAGWVGTITDFTDLVAARDDLRRAETLFLNTFDQAPLGIVYADRGGNFLRFNRAFCTMLGFEPRDFADKKTLSDLTCVEDAGRVTLELERLWNGDQQFVDLEKRYTRKDGSIIWVRTTTSLVRESEATPQYSVEFMRDVSARKAAAAELERVHKQLVTASRQAGMAEVATNVLHNVGNILNSINISASLVSERIKQSKAPGVSRVAILLQEKGSAAGEFIANDERGKRIPEYLTSLGEQLMADQKRALEELASLRDNLEHI